MALYARLSLPLQVAKVRFHGFEKKCNASLAAGPYPAVDYSRGLLQCVLLLKLVDEQPDT
jgi:hypothetical protein